MSAVKGTLRLDSACTLRECEDLHFSLLAAVTGAGPCLIDGSAVERVDTAGLQMLAALFRQRGAAGLDTGWVAVSPEIGRAAAILGLEKILQLPAAATPRVDACR